MRIYRNITETIGRTPLVELSRLAAGLPGRVIAKVESFNPLSCVKERIALSMIDAAIADGRVTQDTEIIEPTSGNTGIGLACVCAARGLALTLVMPESMSEERMRIVRALGAKLLLSPAKEGMAGSIRLANELAARTPSAYIPMQFANPNNPKAHHQTTAMEIWEDTQGQVDIVVAGVGTGGTITGLGRSLKMLKPAIQTIAVEPAGSAVLSGCDAGSHGIQGIGAGFVPDVLDVELVDHVVPIATEDAKTTARRLARQEGILAGISAGAAVAVALELAADPANRGRLIVAILPDTGERYLSTDLFSEPSQ